jgi:hypothetical protein
MYEQVHMWPHMFRERQVTKLWKKKKNSEIKKLKIDGNQKTRGNFSAAR